MAGLRFQGRSSAIQLRDPIDRVLGDPREHIAQAGFRIEPAQRGGADQAVHRCSPLAACRLAGRGDHEPDPIGAPQRARALRLSEGRPHPPADSAAESDRGVSAASVEAG